MLNQCRPEALEDVSEDFKKENQKEWNTLSSANSAFASRIGAIRDADKTEPEAKLNLYTTEELFKDNLDAVPPVMEDLIAVALRKQIDKVTAFNEKVKAEKTRFATEAANQLALEGATADLNKQIETLNAIKNTIKASELAKYGDQKTYVANTVAGELSSVEATLAGLQTQLDDLKADEGVKNGTTKVDNEALSTSITEFEQSLKALAESVNAAADQLKVWYDFQTLSQKLLSTYNSGLKDLRELKSVNDNYTVVENRAAELENVLTGIYNEAAKNFTIQADKPETATPEAVEEDSASANKAIEDINAAVDEFKALVLGSDDVVGQNPLMKTYLETLTAFNTTYQSVKESMEKLEASAGLAEFQKKIDAAYQEAVLFKDAIDAAYNKLELKADGTIDTLDGATFEAVNEAIAAEMADLQKQLQPITDLQTALDQAQADLEKLAEQYIAVEANRPVMVGKFDDSVKNLQDAINALTIPVSDDKKADITAAISNLTAQAEILFKAYSQSADLIADFQKTVAELEKVIDGKLILSGSAEFKANFRKSNAAYIAVLAQLNGGEDVKGETQLFDEALAATGEQCLDLFTALVETCLNYDYASAVEAVARKFEETGTQRNADTLVPVKNLADAAYADAKGCPGYDALTTLLNEATNVRYQATVDFDAAKAAEAYSTDEYTRIDGEFQKALKLYDQIIADSSTYQSYKAYYTEDVNRLDGIVKAFDEYMQNYRNNPDGTLLVWEDRCDQLNEVIAALRANMKDVYENKYADPENGYGSLVVRMSLDSQISTLGTAIKNFELNIEANEANYIDLKGSASNVRTLINNTIALIEKAKAEQLGETAPDGDRYIDECLQTLDQLLVGAYETEDGTTLTNLADLSAQAGADYSEGKLAVNANYRDLADALDALAKVAQGISQQFSDNLDQIIVSYNTETFTKAYEQAISLAEARYQMAVQVYNSYMYGLKNEGYMAFEVDGRTLQQIIGDHGDMYQYIDIIKGLEQQMIDYLAVMNGTKEIVNGEAVAAEGTPVAITDADLNAEIAKITKVETEINEALIAMQMDGANFALKYAQATKAAADEFIADAQKKMADAGISTTSDAYKMATEANSQALQSAEKLFADAVKKYEEEVANDGIGNLGIETDQIAFVYDLAFAAIDFDKAANAQWFDELNGAAEKVYDLDKIVKDATFIPTDDPLREEYKEARDLIVALFDKDATIDTLPDLHKQLEEALAKAEKIANQIKNKSDKAEGEQNALDKWNGFISDGQASIDALRAFVDSLAAGNDSMLKGAEAALAALRHGVSSNSGNLVANEANGYLPGLQRKLNEAVYAAYATAATAEVEDFKAWASKLEVAYNDANVNSTTLTEEEKEALKTRVDAVAPAIPVWNIAATATIDKLEAYAMEYSAKCVKLESEIAELYNTLQGSWDADKNGNANPNIDPVATANEEVAEAAAAATTTLTDGQSALNAALESVQKVYAEKYEAYAEELDAINAAVEGEGADIVLSYEKYIDKYNTLAAAVKATNEALAAAQEAAAAEAAAKEANAEAATRLDGELAAKQAMLDTLNETLKAYGEDIAALYSAQAKWIQTQIDNAQKAIDAAEEAVELTKDSKLSEFLDTAFDAWINNVRFLAAQKNAENYQPRLTQKAYDTQKAIGELNVVPEKLSEIDAALKEQLKAIAEFTDGLKAAKTVADYDKLSEDAKAILEAYDNILATAKEYVFVLGDVNLDPDGAVNVLDVQALITMVGQGVTYQELYAENPVKAAAADVLGDKMINISDVTAEIDLVFNTASQSMMRLVSRASVANAGTIGALLLGEEDGVSTYAVMVGSDVDFVAGQFDISVADGSEIVDARMSGNSHSLYRFDNSESTRFIVASMDNASIDMVGGNLLIIQVRGNAAPIVEGAIFTDATAKAYHLNATGTSGIDGVNVENGTMTQRIYNAAGQAMRAIQRGINIIRHSDGTTTKELHK